VGSDADIVVWDMKQRKTISARNHHMRVDYNVYEGSKVRGVPVQVYLRGKQIINGSEWVGENGKGQFIARQPYAQVI